MTATATKDPAQRKRARPLPRAERRAQLLDAARAIVREQGIGGLTMEALAERAGASKPVVYEHFRNAEDVAIALLDAYFRTMIETVAARTADAQSLDEYLAIAIAAQFEFHSGDRLVVRSITNGHASGERLNAMFLKMRDSSVRTLSELLMQQGAGRAEAQTAGYVLWEMIGNAVYEFAMKDDAAHSAQTVTAMVLGAVHALVPDTSARPVTPDAILETARRDCACD